MPDRNWLDLTCTLRNCIVPKRQDYGTTEDLQRRFQNRASNDKFKILARLISILKKEVHSRNRISRLGPWIHARSKISKHVQTKLNRNELAACQIITNTKDLQLLCHNFVRFQWQIRENIIRLLSWLCWLSEQPFQVRALNTREN